MAFGAGRNAVLMLDNAQGALTNITKYTTEFGMPREPEQLETTTLGDQEKSYIPGFVGAGVSINGRFDGAAAAIHDILATAVGASGTNSKRTFQFGPEGNASGKVRYSGELVILSYEVTTGASDIVGFTANARVDGTITKDTW